MSGDDPAAIMPDIQVPTTSADWLAGRDPVLEKVIEEYNKAN